MEECQVFQSQIMMLTFVLFHSLYTDVYITVYIYYNTVFIQFCKTVIVQ